GRGGGAAGRMADERVGAVTAGGVGVVVEQKGVGEGGLAAGFAAGVGGGEVGAVADVDDVLAVGAQARQGQAHDGRAQQRRGGPDAVADRVVELTGRAAGGRDGGGDGVGPGRGVAEAVAGQDQLVGPAVV